VDRPPVAGADDERVEEGAVVGRQQHPARGDVLAALAPEAEVDEHRRDQDRARDPVDGHHHAARAGALVVARKDGVELGTAKRHT
jgi:hypothetical protein